MAIDIEADLVAALDNHRAGHLAEAAMLYARVIAADPEHAGALHNLGVVKAQLGDPVAALRLFDRALAADPNYVHARLNRAGALRALRRQGEAAEGYAAALARSPNLYAGHFAAALVLAALGRDGEAMVHFKRCHAMRRAAPPPDGVSRYKLRHDIEQLRWLAAEGIEAGPCADLAEHFTALEGRVEWPGDDGEPAVIDDPTLADTFRHPPHVASAAAVEGSPLAAGFDAGEVARAFAGETSGVAVIDRLLSDEALAALRRSLLESTVWYDFTHIPGFVAAYLEDGLASPLLLQIARALREALPDLLGPHRLIQGWAFRGVAGDVPVELHADAAAVSINFWITPDTASDDPAHGGLVIHTVRPPDDWEIRDYNRDATRIRDFLASQPDRTLTVPYGENRAVLFDSGLFHGSDAPRFRPGFEDHRVNITLLFGDRTENSS